MDASDRLWMKVVMIVVVWGRHYMTALNTCTHDPPECQAYLRLPMVMYVFHTTTKALADSGYWDALYKLWMPAIDFG